MLTSSPLAYAYAKATGLYGKSFIAGSNSRLLSLSRLSDLDRLLFPQNPLEVPEKELSRQTERRIIERSLERIKRVLKAWREPPAVLVQLLRAVELSDLKAAMQAKAQGDRLCPPYSDLSPFGRMRWEAWPDIAKISADSEYAWVGKREIIPEKILEIELECDRQYYNDIWKMLPAASDIKAKKQSPLKAGSSATIRIGARPSLRTYISEEISLKNLTWALRLHVYYGYSKERIESFLIDIPSLRPSLMALAKEALLISPDDEEGWQNFRRSDLVNPTARGRFWTIDPVFVQNRAATYRARRARRLFRLAPFTVDALGAWLRLVQHEEDLLTAFAEGLSLGLTARDIVEGQEVSYA